ncbi:MAG: DNA-directed RNA polymerase subunit L [Candidatus Diapherotrites archaeon]|nr:DNA-directed RNA polymerase subunit L [Candidatus Diapherotrites archaeon]
MELEVISKDKNLLEFRLKGERHSLPNLLKARLSENKSVEFVSYMLAHPLDTDAVFVIRTKGKDPVKVLEEGLEEIETELESFEAGLKKALK